ncbi:hypothetical protein GCM10010507_17990 [Streptomyces cinnamoneus]|uniref:Uncharacterized protein n=1 Tax=Streptomyces cinnamoneus TaxID=53446 RepID=A0A918TF86_STRCJ|nr:hypothetical protein GCM10010507_17990 [Streptomyces cinnamoneus]
MRNARTADVRTGSGIRGLRAGSSTHNGLRAYDLTSRSWSMAAHLPQWLPKGPSPQEKSEQ